MDFGRFLGGLAATVGGLRTLKSALEPSEEERARRRQEAQLRAGDMKVTTREVKNLDERIGYITRQIVAGREHPDVHAWTREVLTRRCKTRDGKETWCVPEKEWNKEVKALFNAFRERVRYVRDWAHKDLYQHPRHTIGLRAGDCDDATSALGAALQNAGYPIKLRVIQTKDSQSWNHIYLLVGLPPDNPSKWVPLDASVAKPAGWEAPRSMVRRVRDFPVG